MLICFFTGIKSAQILSALFITPIIISYKLAGTGANSAERVLPGEKKPGNS
jgi:hypothetical protein